MQGIAASTATVEIENQNRIQLEVEERRGKPSFLQMLLATKGSHPPPQKKKKKPLLVGYTEPEGGRGDSGY